jgi:hypothetical protein
VKNDSIACLNEIFDKNLGFYFPIVEKNTCVTKIALFCNGYTGTLQFTFSECRRRNSVPLNGRYLNITSIVPVGTIDFLSLR